MVADAASLHHGVMEDRAEALRRCIALYRRLLEEGADVDLARHYLREIISATTQLERITRIIDQAITPITDQAASCDRISATMASSSTGLVKTLPGSWEMTSASSG